MCSREGAAAVVFGSSSLNKLPWISSVILFLSLCLKVNFHHAKTKKSSSFFLNLSALVPTHSSTWCDMFQQTRIVGFSSFSSLVLVPAIGVQITGLLNLE
jgi:hypothetical protein